MTTYIHATMRFHCFVSWGGKRLAVAEVSRAQPLRQIGTHVRVPRVRRIGHAARMGMAASHRAGVNNVRTSHTGHTLQRQSATKSVIKWHACTL